MIRHHPYPGYTMGTVPTEAAELLRSQGLSLPNKPPNEMPQLPEDVTDLSDRDLMQTYATYVAWSEYANTQLAIASVDEKHAEREHNLIELRTQARYRDAGDNVTTARSNARLDDDVQQAYQRVINAEAYRKLLEVVASNCDKAAALLSRELTRRTSGEQQRRHGNWLT